MIIIDMLSAAWYGEHWCPVVYTVYCTMYRAQNLPMNVYDISSRKKFVYIEQSAVAASLPPPPSPPKVQLFPPIN